MRRPRLIATDLDGTFLTPDNTVSALNTEATRRAAEQGIPLVIATGRPTRWLGVLSELTAAHPQVIVSNGAAIFDLATGTIVRAFPLDPAVATQVASDLRRAIPGLTFGIETGSRFGCEPQSPSLQAGEPGVHHGALEDLLSAHGPVIKILGFHPHLTSDRLTALARETVGERLTLTHAATGDPYGMLELTAPGVTKATTLALLCAELGVDAREVAAFGDMPNDLEMLAWVGMPHVVANAHPSLLATGFPVVGSNADSGVGRAILDLLGTAPRA